MAKMSDKGEVYMNMITDEVFDRVLALSELELDRFERESIKKDMEVMIEFFAELNEADDFIKTSDSMGANEKCINSDRVDEQDVHTRPRNVFRDDVVNDITDNSMLKNVLKMKDGYIVVPKTVK